MKIAWKVSPDSPRLLELCVDDVLWKKVDKSLFIRILKKIQRCGSRQELEERWQKLEEEAAWILALRTLARRSYFSAELREKLTLRGISSSCVEKVVGLCEARGYLSDADLHARVVASEVRKGKGPRMIALRLKKRKSPVDFAALKSIDQKKCIEELLPKLTKKYTAKTPQGKQKIFQALQRRGFDIEHILSCFEEKFRLR